MSSTTIRFQDSEFVANDLPIELWLLEVGNQIDANDESWLNRLKEEWHLQATTGFGFGPSPALDEYVTSDDRRRVLVALFLKAIEALNGRSHPFTPRELTELGVGGDEAIYSVELPTQMVVNVGNQFLSLLSHSK